jgi:hypothetical protein
MKAGMLWQDNEKGKSFEQKILEAKKYFTKKYGYAPDTCHVNPVENENFLEIPGIEIIFDKTILPHNYWMGTEEDREFKRATLTE